MVKITFKILYYMLTPDQSKILELLCSCQPDNIALAEALAKGLNINIVELLEQEGFFELGIKRVADIDGWCALGLIDSRNISSLRAIKYFPNLTFLNCDNNTLNNLHGIEYLAELTTFFCSQNSITDMSGIEKLEKLTKIQCHSNLLTNLRGLENLKWINCSYNPLDSLLGVEHFTKLTHLECSDTNLKNLNPLKYLTKLEYLDCSENPITDLSPLFHLPNLKVLKCNGYGNKKIAASEIDNFQQQQPNCELIRICELTGF